MGLRRALKDALAEAQKPIAGTVAPYPPGKRDRLVGRAVLGEMARVPAGRYDVVIRTPGRAIERKAAKVHGNVVAEPSATPPAEPE